MEALRGDRRTNSVRVDRRVEEDFAPVDTLTIADLLDSTSDSLPDDLSPLISLLRRKLVAERRERGDVVAVEEMCGACVGRFRCGMRSLLP